MLFRSLPGPLGSWRGQRVLRRFPLAKLQQGLLFHRDVSDDYVTYSTTVELRGRVDTELLRSALADVAERHEVLRTAIDVTADDGPEQVVLAEAALPLCEHDLLGLTAEEQERSVDAWTETVRKRPFHWERAPLFEFHLHRVAEDRALLSVIEPLLDGWSVTVLLRDVLDAYETLHARAAGLPLPATAERWPSRKTLPSYAEFVRLEREAERAEQTREFWRSQLTTAGEARWSLALAKDRSARPGEWHRRNHVLDESEVAALTALADRLRVPVKSVLMAVHARTVSLFSGGGRAATGVMVNGRPETEGSADACGLFLNILPLTVDPSSATSWEELITRVREWESTVWRHRRLPYSTIVEDAGVDGVDSVFNFTNFHRYEDPITDEGRCLRMGEVTGLDQTYFDITVQCSLDPQGQRLRVSVDSRFPSIGDEDAARMLDYFVHLLRSVVADPHAAPADSALTGADAGRLRRLSGADDVRDWPAVDNLAAVGDEHARKHPETVAMAGTDGVWTYERLSQGSTACARAILEAAPHRSGDPAPVVAVLATRSTRYWAAVLGIWRAGATYLPISPDLPHGRIATMLRQAGAEVVVTDDAMDPVLQAELAAGGVRTIAVSVTEAPAKPAAPFARTMADRAYIVFTSGSTGEPKGACIGPDAMFNHLMSKANLLGLDDTGVVAQVAPASFDQSIWQCMAPWLVGGKVLVVDEALMLAPPRLVDAFAEHGVTVFETVPSHLAVLLEAIECGSVAWPRPGMALKHLMVSGEALTADLTARWFEVASCPLINAYGATECADDFTHAVLRGPQPGDPVSIGSPIPNCVVEVVDGEGRPLPIGVAGELQASGRPVGLGYVNPEHEEGRFEERTGPEGTRHVYRTGDLVRFRNDGQLVWLSRLDDDIKFRGRRMSLGEIDHHLRDHEGVADAVTIVVRRPEGEHLRAVVVGDEDRTGAAILRDHLAQRVPRWMLPDEILTVAGMPLTPHGKVDRAALAALPSGTASSRDTPRPARRAALIRETASDGAVDEVAEAVRDEWIRVLGRRPAADSDFFRDGGASLDSVRLAARVGARLGAEVDAATLLRAPRFDAFVQTVTSLRPAVDRPSTPPALRVNSPEDLRYLEAADSAALLGEVPGGRLDAAAIGYVSTHALARTGMPKEEVLAAVGATEPLLRRVFITPAGTVGHFLVPLVTGDLFADPGRTAAVVARAVRNACAMGARCTALTGMLASSLDYGAALAPGVPPGSVTTGHDVTASAVVLNLTRAMEQTGTRFADHEVSVVGLGSVGTAATRLAVEVLGSPRKINLVDGPGHLARAEQAAKELVEAGCTAVIECAESAPDALPDLVYEGTLIVGAASAHGVMDIDRVAPGTIVNDDSSPHLFDVDRAVARHRSGDIHVTEGGMLLWPAPLSEIRWRPQDPRLASVLGAIRSHRSGRSAMGCITAGVLRTDGDGPVPVIGRPGPEHVRRTYRALTEQGFGGTAALLEDRPVVRERA